MGQLVDHEIAHHLRALEHQAAIQADRAACGATAPATALAPDQHPLKIKTQLPGQGMQVRAEHVGRALSEPATQELSHGTTIIRITLERQQPIAYLLQAQTLSNSGEVNPPHFSASCEIDLRWGKRRCGNCASSCLFAFTLDPRAMSLDESLDSERRRTRRHDD